MNNILKYVHDNIHQSLLAGDVAEKFGYSRWYFCNRFKAFTGKTFAEYVRHCRVQLAALEILSGKKVLDVAMDYGYESVGGFNKAFMKEYGCAPTEYRKQAKECQLYYEKRRASMFPLSDRCAWLREEAVTRKSYQKFYEAQGCVYFCLGRAEAILAGAAEPAVLTSCGTARI